MAILGTIIAYAGLALVNVGVLCVEFAWWALPAVVIGTLLLVMGSLLADVALRGGAENG